MGWEDAHLHEFQVTLPISNFKIEIGLPDGNEYLHSTKVKMKK
jgi:hypothetical protein